MCTRVHSGTMLARTAIRTSFVLALAGSAVLSAALLAPRRAPVTCQLPATRPLVDDGDVVDDGFVLTAAFPSRALLADPRGADVELAVAITAPRSRAPSRPPLSLAVVIDRSGSMNGDSPTGRPIDNAKLAATRLIEALDDGDAFTVITYSSGDETVLPMMRATPANRAAAAGAIAAIRAVGGTCISCGLERAARELGHTPIEGGVHRVMLLSDGQANEGIYDRDDLARLAGELAARGTSISTGGVGLEFDELTMQRLAQVGHGNYYFVADAAGLAATFTGELGALADTVAADVRLEVRGVAGAIALRDAYGYPLEREGDAVLVPIADLRAGETRKVVLRAHVADARAGIAAIARAHLTWRRVVDGQRRQGTAHATATVVADAAAVAAGVDRDATTAIEQARSARAIDEASAAFARGDLEGARRTLAERQRQLHEDAAIGAAAAGELDAAFESTARGFAGPAAAAPHAVKAARERAYQLAR